MSHVKYIAKEGDRWDSIAYYAYGNATLISPIIEANPNIPKEPFIEAGTTVYIPVKETPSVNVNLLPIWKR
jgi:phage tail protein X